jgi:Mn-dependent DtxR family transcriptional regulator
MSCGRSQLLDTDSVPLRQKALAEMLDVRPTSISDVAGKMQNAGTTSRSRGVIQFLELARRHSIAYPGSA